MERAKGFFVGEEYVGSTYDDVNGFTDILREDFYENNIPLDIIYSSETNDISADNQLQISLSLAYRSFFEMRKKNNLSKRVYEIICSDSNVCSYSIVGLGSKEVTVEMSQTMIIDNIEDKNLLILEYVYSVYEEQFRGNEEVEKLGDLIDQYRTDVLCGNSKNLLFEKYKPLEECIEKIQSYPENFYFEFAGYETIVPTKPLRKIVLRELAKEYLVSIQTLASNMSSNFGVGDCIYVYTDIPDFSINYKSEIDEIGLKNHVVIETFNDKRIAIAQGNAYYNYLFNDLYVKQIKESIGKYVVSYGQQEHKLNEIQGDFLISIENDFQVFPILEVIDIQSGSKNEWEITIPFFKCGDVIEVMYMFENEFVQLQACHSISGEKSIYTLTFRK